MSEFSRQGLLKRPAMRYRYRFAIISAAAVALVALTSATPAAAQTVNNNITSFASLRCLDAKAQELGRNGTTVQLWDCYGLGQNNQRWYLYRPVASRSEVQIRSFYDARCLEADWNGINANGTKVQLWDCLGADRLNQLWDIYSTSTPGVYQVRNAHNNRCLDADYHGIGHNGTRVQLWDCYGQGSYNQYWRFPGILTP